MEYSISIMIKTLDTMFETIANKELSDLKLTHSQLQILLYVKTRTERNIEVNQIDIEKHFNLKNPTVTGILNRLEDKSYIERQISSKNARCKKIIVTDMAKKIINLGKKQVSNLEEELMNCLEKEEKQEFKKILNKIIKNNIKENK